MENVVSAFLPSTDSDDIISHREYKEHQAWKVLRRRMPKYIRSWLAKRQIVEFRIKCDSIRGLAAGYLTRKNLSFLLDTNLDLRRSPCIFILREHKVVF